MFGDDVGNKQGMSSLPPMVVYTKDIVGLLGQMVFNSGDPTSRLPVWKCCINIWNMVSKGKVVLVWNSEHAS